MKLTHEQIDSIATGNAYTEKKDGRIYFHRFTKAQEEYYRSDSLNSSNFFYDRCHATAGVKLCFTTNSKTIFISVEAKKYTSRDFFSVDVFSDGKCIGNIDNFGDINFQGEYDNYEFPLGEFSKSFSLGDGTKNVSIYFPWSVELSVREISIDDGAQISPSKRKLKLLAFGDSITQGYDAVRPSNRYVSLLSDMLGADEYNKGIGGEFFVPKLSELSDDFTPDLITVAYGTNDWSGKEEDDFKKRCRNFYLNLRKTYPETHIFALTPIWRKDYLEKRNFGDFFNVAKGICEAVEDIHGITVIDCFGFVPEDEQYFGDLRLHPNDEGFKKYSRNLGNAILRIIPDLLSYNLE